MCITTLVGVAVGFAAGVVVGVFANEHGVLTADQIKSASVKVIDRAKSMTNSTPAETVG